MANGYSWEDRDHYNPTFCTLQLDLKTYKSLPPLLFSTHTKRSLLLLCKHFSFLRLRFRFPSPNNLFFFTEQCQIKRVFLFGKSFSMQSPSLIYFFWLFYCRDDMVSFITAYTNKKEKLSFVTTNFCFANFDLSILILRCN